MKQGMPKPRGFHWMLYGPPGVGKTTVISQMPKPTAILDTDGGAGWLYHNLDNVSVFQLVEDEDPAKAVEDFLKAGALGKGPAADFASVAVDTLSALRGAHLSHLAGGGLFYEIGDYGTATNWLRRVLLLTQYSPQVICWTTHVSEEQDGPRLVYRPSGLSDTGRELIAQKLDAIVFMGRSSGGKGGESKRFLTTQEIDPVNGRAAVLAKDRTGLLPDVMDFPGLDDDGNPPDMFGPFFGDVMKQLNIGTEPAKSPAKSKAKPAVKK